MTNSAYSFRLTVLLLTYLDLKITPSDWRSLPTKSGPMYLDLRRMYIAGVFVVCTSPVCSSCVYRRCVCRVYIAGVFVVCISAVYSSCVYRRCVRRVYIDRVFVVCTSPVCSSCVHRRCVRRVKYLLIHNNHQTSSVPMHVCRCYYYYVIIKVNNNNDNNIIINILIK